MEEATKCLFVARRLSVRLSVTCQYSAVETAKHITKFFSPRIATPSWFSVPNNVAIYSDVDPYRERRMQGGVRKYCDFQPIFCFVSGMIQDRAIVTAADY